MSKVALITGVTGQDGSYLAEFLLEKMKAEIENTRHYLEKLEKNSQLKLEAQARERLGAFYNQVLEQENLEAISKALENKIQGYGIQDVYPVQTFLDQLIDGYGDIHAAQQLKEVRRKIKNAIAASTGGNVSMSKKIANFLPSLWLLMCLTVKLICIYPN